jgi:hypothetical protein
VLILIGIALLYLSYGGVEYVSGFGLIIQNVLQAALQMNILLAVLRFIQHTVLMMFIDYIARNPESADYARLMSIITTLGIILIFGSQLQLFFIWLSRAIAMAVCCLF